VWQFTERLRAGDAIDVQTAVRLEADHRMFGQRSVPAVDRSWCEAGGSQATLERPDQVRSVRDVSVARTEDELGRGQRRHRDGAVDAVHRQAVRGLEAHHRRLGERPVASVDWAWRKRQAGQPALQGPYGLGTVNTAEAVPEDEHVDPRVRSVIRTALSLGGGRVRCHLRSRDRWGPAAPAAGLTQRERRAASQHQHHHRRHPSQDCERRSSANQWLSVEALPRLDLAEPPGATRGDTDRIAAPRRRPQ
jgi:hypothetical protein